MPATSVTQQQPAAAATKAHTRAREHARSPDILLSRPTLPLEITLPVNHSWWHVTANASTLEHLPVRFATHNGFRIPRDGYLLVTSEKLPPGGHRFTDTASDFVLMGLVPGTHFITFALFAWDDTAVPGGATVLHIEVVVPQRGLSREWHYELQASEKRPVTLVNLHRSRSKAQSQSTVALSSVTELLRDRQASYAAAAQLHGQSQSTPASTTALSATAAASATTTAAVATTSVCPVIPVCFVGTMAGPIDGQKRMWLQLMHALGPTAQHHSNSNNSCSIDSSGSLQHTATASPTFAFQMKAFENAQGDTPMKRALRALNVSLHTVELTVRASLCVATRAVVVVSCLVPCALCAEMCCVVLEWTRLS